MVPETTPPSTNDRTALTNAAAARYMPRVRRHAVRIARRLPRHVQVGDLVSAGLVGLVDAFLRFDRERVESFEAYIDHRIRGAILDELRAFDPLTRDQRLFARRVAAARQVASNETGRAPDEGEVAAAMGVSLAQYRAQLERIATTAARTEAAPLDDELADVSESSPGRPDDIVERHQTRTRVAAAVDRLPSRKREVLRMHYDEGRTLREIGERLGVTESRVSQIHSEAVGRLRVLLADA